MAGSSWPLPLASQTEEGRGGRGRQRAPFPAGGRRGTQNRGDLFSPDGAQETWWCGAQATWCGGADPQANGVKQEMGDTTNSSTLPPPRPDGGWGPGVPVCRAPNRREFYARAVV